MKKYTKISRARDVRLGRRIRHENHEGICSVENGKPVVISGTDGFYPLDILKWGGELLKVNKVEREEIKEK